MALNFWAGWWHWMMTWILSQKQSWIHRFPEDRCFELVINPLYQKAQKGYVHRQASFSTSQVNGSDDVPKEVGTVSKSCGHTTNVPSTWWIHGLGLSGDDWRADSSNLCMKSSATTGEKRFSIAVPLLWSLCSSSTPTLKAVCFKLHFCFCKNLLTIK